MWPDPFTCAFICLSNKICLHSIQLNTGKVPPGGLPRNTDRPDMTSGVYRGRKASNQINKQIIFIDLKDGFWASKHSCMYKVEENANQIFVSITVIVVVILLHQVQFC